MKKHIDINIVELLQRIICLVLSLVMLGNLTVEAMPRPDQLRQRIATEIEKQTAPVLSPSEMLSDINAKLKLAFGITEGDKAQEKQDKEDFKPMSREEFNSLYTSMGKDSLAKNQKELNASYEQQLAEIETGFQQAYEEAEQQFADSDSASKELQFSIYKQSLSEEKAQYIKDLDNEFNQAKKELQAEFDKYQKDMPNEYEKYMKGVWNTEEEIKQTVLTGFHTLMNQAVAAHKEIRQDEAQRKKADEEFLNIIILLSSIKDKETVFEGTDLAYIRDTFLEKLLKNNACRIHEGEDDQPELDDPDACENAISALIPYGNLNGSAFKIKAFLSSHAKEGPFGSILPIAVRALLLTKDPEAMDEIRQIVSGSIAQENSARKKEWEDTDWLDYLSLVTAERSIMTARRNGPYAAHNVVLSGNQGAKEPHAWEDVAEMLSLEMKKGNQEAREILQLAIDQCKIDANSEKQWITCKGIYPFLLGVLRFAPELAENLKVTPIRLTDREGDVFLANGSVKHISAQEAANNRKFIAEHSLLQWNLTKAEVLAGFLYRRVFAGQTAAEKMRIDNLIARDEEFLNNHRHFYQYNEHSSRHQTLVNMIATANAMDKVAVSLDIVVTVLCLVDLLFGIVKAAKAAKGLGLLKLLFNASKVREVTVGFKLVNFGDGARLINAFRAANLDPQILRTLIKWKKRFRPITHFKANAMETFRSAFATKYVFGSSVAPVAKATMVASTDIKVAAVAKTLRMGSIGAVPSVGGVVPSLSYTPLRTAASAAAEVASVGETAKKASLFEGFWAAKTQESAKIKLEDSGVTYLKKPKTRQGLRFRKQEPIEELSIKKDGTLYVNNEMFKVFKAYLPADQVEAFSAIIKEGGLGFNFDGGWIRLAKESDLPGTASTVGKYKEIVPRKYKKIRKPKVKKASKGNPVPEVEETPVSVDDQVIYVAKKERQGIKGFAKRRINKYRAAQNDVITVPLYNEAGEQILAVGFNPGIPEQRAMLEKLNPMALKAAAKDASGLNPINWARKIRARKISSTEATAKLVYKDGKFYLREGDALTHLAQYKGVCIPKTVFSNIADKSEVVRNDILNKLFTLKSANGEGVILAQTRSKLFYPMLVNALSYSASASAISMTMEQADIEAGREPDPIKSVLVSLTLPYTSAIFAPFLAPFVARFGSRRILNMSMGLALSSLSVAMMQGWYGFGIENDAPQNFLLWNAALTGLAATGVRASSNALLKGYETSEHSMVFSMMFKSAGALLTTLVPWAFSTSTGGSWKQDGEVQPDFSIAFPFFAGLTAWAMLGMTFRFPNIKCRKLTMPEAWAQTKQASVKLLPYVTGIALMATLEGYAYFKGKNAEYRDIAADFEASPINSKFVSAICTAVPQVLMRLGGIRNFRWAKRASHFETGVAKSITASLLGTSLFILPETGNTATDVTLGAVSGLLLGLGTANVFQYVQKLALSRANALGIHKDIATTVYSAGNIGLAIPVLPAVLAASLRKDGTGELESVRETAWIPMLFGLTGAGLIAYTKGFKALRLLDKPAVRVAGTTFGTGTAIQTAMNLGKLLYKVDPKVYVTGTPFGIGTGIQIAAHIAKLLYKTNPKVYNMLSQGVWNSLNDTYMKQAQEELPNNDEEESLPEPDGQGEKLPALQGAY